MGKMKYAATEDNFQQPVIRKHRQHQYQRKQNALGYVFQEQEEGPPLNTLFRQIYLRFRRVWIALRFHGNRFTLGAFRERSSLKLATISILCYFLFFSDRQPWLFTSNPPDESMHIGLVESAQEVSQKTGGKSIDWNREAKPKSAAPKLGPSTNPAPMFAEQMRGQSVEKYVARYSKIAVQEMKKYGIPASISLAQGLVESRYGTSKLAVRNNNHFGMKCFSKNCKDGHCTNFEDDHHKDFFRRYKTPWESWRAHSLMLANGRYARLKKHGKNYKNWAYGLESLGYATDKTYAEKLIGVVQRYNLQRFDRM